MCATWWECMHRVAQNKRLFVHVLYVYNKIHKYDNVRVAPRALVKALLSVSSTGCKNEQQSFVKLSNGTIDNVMTSLLLAGLQDFFQVLNFSNAKSVGFNRWLFGGQLMPD